MDNVWMPRCIWSAENFKFFQKFRKNFTAFNKRDDNAVIEAFDSNIIWYLKMHDENVS